MTIDASEISAILKSEIKTLGDAVDSYLKRKSLEIKATSLKEYSEKLHNQVLL